LAALSGIIALIMWPQLTLLAEEDSPGIAPERTAMPACILIWLDGGPPTIDMWDLKHGTRHGGPFRSIATAGKMKICEHLPKIAQVMDKLSIIRSMSSRMEVEGRAHHYMHTCYVPNPYRDHPSVSAVIARELSWKRPELSLPAFISLNGPSAGQGYDLVANMPNEVVVEQTKRHGRAPWWLLPIRLRFWFTLAGHPDIGA